MNDEQVKRFWDETIEKHGGSLFLIGGASAYALWCGFVLALERPELISYSQYERLALGKEPIELKLDIKGD